MNARAPRVARWWGCGGIADRVSEQQRRWWWRWWVDGWTWTRTLSVGAQFLYCPDSEYVVGLLLFRFRSYRIIQPGARLSRSLSLSLFSSIIWQVLCRELIKCITSLICAPRAWYARTFLAAIYCHRASKTAPTHRAPTEMRHVRLASICATPFGNFVRQFFVCTSRCVFGVRCGAGEFIIRPVVKWIRNCEMLRQWQNYSSNLFLIIDL